MPQLKLVQAPAEFGEPPAVFSFDASASAQSPRFRIGRLKRECDLALLSDYVSKRHVELAPTDEGWTIVDVGSRAGTKVNGARMEPLTPRRLRHGDEIRFCGYQFVWLDDESDSRTGGSNELQVFEDDSGFASVISKPDRSWSQLTGASAEHKLQMLLEMIRDLRNPTEIEQQLRRLIERVFKMAPKSRRVTIVVRSHPAQVDGFFVSVTRRSDSGRHDAGLRQAVIEAVLTNQNAVLTDDRQVICAPLVDRHDATLGCIQLETFGAEDQFTARELELVVGAALLISLAIENDVYFAAVARERVQQEELRMAHEIQRRLLPPPRDRAGSVEIFAHYAAALEVGGDYYDLVDLPNGGLAVAVGDVSGKGVPAALVMAKISSEIRTLVDLGYRPAHVLDRVNRNLVDRGAGGNFITLALLFLDPDTHRLTLANAGHPRPLLRTPDGRIVELGDQEAGLALGVCDDERYVESEYDLPVGASLFLYSDGVSEARADDGRLFGVEGLRSAIDAELPDAARYGRQILDHVEKHLGDHTPQDDLCLVCLRRAASPA